MGVFSKRAHRGATIISYSIGVALISVAVFMAFAGVGIDLHMISNEADDSPSPSRQLRVRPRLKLKRLLRPPGDFRAAEEITVPVPALHFLRGNTPLLQHPLIARTGLGLLSCPF